MKTIRVKPSTRFFICYHQLFVIVLGLHEDVSRPGPETGTGAGPRTGAGAEAETGPGTGAGAGAEAETGPGTGAGAGAEAETGPGTGAGAGAEAETGPGTGAGAEFETEAAGSESGMDMGMNPAGKFNFFQKWGLIWGNEEARSRATGPADLAILWF